MIESKLFKDLIQRVDFLEKNILPIANPLGDYTDKEQDLIRTYILLTHAEIEYFLEKRCVEIVETSLKKWANYKLLNNCLLSLVLYLSNKINFPDPFYGNDFTERLNRIVSHYKSGIVGKNNGIKKENILELLIPVGIEESKLDTTWLNEMDNFGSTRGIIAHNSSYGTRIILDPDNYKDKVNKIHLKELKNIEELLHETTILSPLNSPSYS